jgi:hypothetical protein
MLNVSRRSSSSELYKVTPTRGIERIYKFIDPNRDTLLSSFQNYDLKQINDYIEINRQVRIFDTFQSKTNFRLKKKRRHDSKCGMF